MEWDGTEDDQRLLRINLVARIAELLEDEGGDYFTRAEFMDLADAGFAQFHAKHAGRRGLSRSVVGAMADVVGKTLTRKRMLDPDAIREAEEPKLSSYRQVLAELLSTPDGLTEEELLERLLRAELPDQRTRTQANRLDADRLRALLEGALSFRRVERDDTTNRWTMVRTEKDPVPLTALRYLFTSLQAVGRALMPRDELRRRYVRGGGRAQHFDPAIELALERGLVRVNGDQIGLSDQADVRHVPLRLPQSPMSEAEESSIEDSFDALVRAVRDGEGQNRTAILTRFTLSLPIDDGHLRLALATIRRHLLSACEVSEAAAVEQGDCAQATIIFGGASNALLRAGSQE